MIPKTLTIVERQILANQFRILANIYDDNSFLIKAEILENGYTGKYNEVFDVHIEEISFDVCKETEEILQMYRVIDKAIKSLNPEEANELDLEKIKFEGFDANNDPHYYYAEFMIEKLELWQEYKDMYLNSHSRASLNKYKRMLKIYKSKISETKWELDKTDLEDIIKSI